MENKPPLSPHIQIYRWQISSLVSISHRITGIINIIAISLFCLLISLMFLSESKHETINLGTGIGFSVLEILTEFNKILKKEKKLIFLILM
mgnify:CR=1 FL=1